MRKTFVLMATCLVSMLASAQIFEVESMQLLPGASYDDARVAGISPAGDYVLMTNNSNQGLTRYDIASGTMTKLTDAEGAGFEVKMSKDGREIVFRERFSADNNLRYNNIVRANVSTNTKQMVAKQQVNNDLLVTPGAKVTLITSECQMYVNKNGKRIHIAPQGDEVNYIWASLSPNQKKILYYVSEMGCYVCNIDGSNSQFINVDCTAPCWYDNNTIVAMNDQDDGHFTTSSSIVAYTLDGKYQVLTSPDMIAMYPFATQGKIAFSTTDGRTYIINVK